MNKTFDEWVELYNRKVPEGFKRDERFTLFYLPQEGFAEIMDAGECVVVYQMCGNIIFWRDFAARIARMLGRNKIGTICVRHIKPYMRRLSFVVYETKQVSEGDYYFFRDKNTGEKGSAFPIGGGTYYVLCEVKPVEL